MLPQVSTALNGFRNHMPDSGQLLATASNVGLRVTKAATEFFSKCEEYKGAIVIDPEENPSIN
jgi:hypothetical protein